MLERLAHRRAGRRAVSVPVDGPGATAARSSWSMPSLLSLLLGSVLALTPGSCSSVTSRSLVHPAERFAPTAVEGFLSDAELAGGRYDIRACAARDGLAASATSAAPGPARSARRLRRGLPEREARGASVLALSRVRPLEPVRAAEPGLLEVARGRLGKR